MIETTPEPLSAILAEMGELAHGFANGEVCATARKVRQWVSRIEAAAKREARTSEQAAALAAPARNCDVGTVKEQTERFEDFCRSNMQFYRDMFGHDDEGRLDGWDCREDCPVGRMINDGKAVADRCQLAWAQMLFDPANGGNKQ